MEAGQRDTARSGVAERLLRRLRPILLHRRALLAFKSGLAAGGAWLLGSQLPGDTATYAYYASLGAISVIYPAVSDSVRESARAVGAILIGALLAVGMAWLAWPNALTVGLIVLLAVAAAGLPSLGEQRHWVATAALFVLVFSGDPPHQYVVSYLAQILLGAVVGLVVNALVPPLNLTDLRTSIEQLRTALVHHFERVAHDLTQHLEPDPGVLQEGFELIEWERADLHGALAEVERSRQGNPRARRHDRAWQVLSERGQALAQIGFLLQNVDLVLQNAQAERYELFDDAVREATAQAFTDLAGLLDQPGEEQLAAARRSVADVVAGVSEARFTSTEERYLAGVVAASAQLALTTAAQLSPVGDPG